MNFSSQESVLTSIKREKFRVEIRKSLQAKEFEDKRSRLIAKNPIDNKENTFYYILNEIASPSQLFDLIDEAKKSEKTDILIKHLNTLSHFMDRWDENFKKELFGNQMPLKLLHLLSQTIKELNHDKHVTTEITYIFFKLTGVCTVKEMRLFEREMLSVFKEMFDKECYVIEGKLREKKGEPFEKEGQVLPKEGETFDTLTNILEAVSNVCYDSTEYSLTVLESGILDNIITIFNFVSEKKKLRDLKEGVIRLFYNMKSNIKNPEDVKNNELRQLCQLCTILFNHIMVPFYDAKEREFAISTAQMLSSLTNTFDADRLFDIFDQNDFFFQFLLEIIDRSEKTQEDFICPILGFFTNLIGQPDIDPLQFMRQGLLETIQSLFEESSTPDVIKAAAMEILGSIRYEYNIEANYESEVFGLFKTHFSQIMRGPVCQTKNNLILVLAIIFKNCDPSDEEVLNFLNDQDIVHRILECVEIDDIKVKENTLELLENILIIGGNEMASKNFTANPYALAISKQPNFKCLEGLLQSQNQTLSEAAQRLLEAYFDGI